ncbi:galactokinase [Paramaledivibacter caminithermalis]|uniref:Galactokinase n=1 Tax=Paramaledivibacter caminithermalis (strain DSM 15212 / CIP 107654 / DViRD3) TaxID=1121301 RepID=A0A1M6NNX1_PARC5|nr:galactokinase [Paramaledivibacter caminithermalis]SHJ97447.1 galactokinase [Paramaledivibacter caminithermalis DSM 15212]
MSLIKNLKRDFIEVFNECSGTRTFFAPGRVNLIGEHTDYNGGHVFPCPLSFGTYVVARKRKDNIVRLYSKNFKDFGIIEFTLQDMIYEEKHGWANYPKGVTKAFMDNGFAIDKGFEAVFFGNIPNGAGLSSSASIELAVSVMLKSLFNLNIDMVSMVKISQKAENEFIGVSCGIMDQFAVGMGRKGKAILLDCNTLKYKYTALDLKDSSIVIANTNKRRGLTDSKYNERRSECERALAKLQEKLSINSLGELTNEEFEENKYLITNEIDRRRAKHAVYENQRTIKAVEALEKGDFKEFGSLMKASHISLRYDYEVTGKELDTLVELAWKQEGTIGSRMTGAGFGGCTVSIVKNSKIDEFIDNVGSRYEEIIGYKADFYVASIGDGARELK